MKKLLYILYAVLVVLVILMCGTIALYSGNYKIFTHTYTVTEDTVSIKEGDSVYFNQYGLKLTVLSIDEVTCPSDAMCILAEGTYYNIKYNYNGHEESRMISGNEFTIEDIIVNISRDKKKINITVKKES